MTMKIITTTQNDETWMNCGEKEAHPFFTYLSLVSYRLANIVIAFLIIFGIWNFFFPFQAMTFF